MMASDPFDFDKAGWVRMSKLDWECGAAHMEAWLTNRATVLWFEKGLQTIQGCEIRDVPPCTGMKPPAPPDMSKYVPQSSKQLKDYND